MVYHSDSNTPLALPEQEDLFRLNPFRFLFPLFYYYDGTGCKYCAVFPVLKMNSFLPCVFCRYYDDATEYFHIQDALSVTTLKSNMSGTLLENNMNGSKTLYVHWIQTDDPEVRAMIFS